MFVLVCVFFFFFFFLRLQCKSKLPYNRTYQSPVRSGMERVLGDNTGPCTTIILVRIINSLRIKIRNTNSKPEVSIRRMAIFLSHDFHVGTLRFLASCYQSWGLQFGSYYQCLIFFMDRYMILHKEPSQHHAFLYLVICIAWPQLFIETGTILFKVGWW